MSIFTCQLCQLNNKRSGSWESSTDLLEKVHVIDRASEHHLELTLSTQSGITSLLSCTLVFVSRG